MSELLKAEVQRLIAVEKFAIRLIETFHRNEHHGGYPFYECEQEICREAQRLEL